MKYISDQKEFDSGCHRYTLVSVQILWDDKCSSLGGGLPCLSFLSLSLSCTCDWIPKRFSLCEVQNWSSALGPGCSPWSSRAPESFFRTFHICPDHWTISVSMEYNKPPSSGLKEAEGERLDHHLYSRMKKKHPCSLDNRFKFWGGMIHQPESNVLRLCPLHTKGEGQQSPPLSASSQGDHDAS